MHAMQNATDADVQLVSFTVDPDHDTPPVLGDYAESSVRTAFALGVAHRQKDTLNTLDRDAFNLGTIGAEMDHSTRFVLVDRKGRIRGILRDCGGRSRW